MRGDAPIVEIVSDSANQRAGGGARRASSGCCAASAASGRCCSLALRGVVRRAARADAGRGPRPRQHADARDAASPACCRSSCMMAVLYGALNAALDTTAGERERGSLEPLLMNPAERWALVRRQVGRGRVRRHADRGAELLQLPARPVAAAQRHAGGDVPVRAARGGAVPRRAAAVRGGAVGAC